MNFQQFQAWRQARMAQSPGLMDCGETQLHRALRPWRAQAEDAAADAAVGRVHRCDLARAWLSRCGWPPWLARRALICRGVRHALRLIFRQLAREGAAMNSCWCATPASRWGAT